MPKLRLKPTQEYELHMKLLLLCTSYASELVSSMLLRHSKEILRVHVQYYTSSKTWEQVNQAGCIPVADTITKIRVVITDKIILEQNESVFILFPPLQTHLSACQCLMKLDIYLHASLVSV